MKKQLTKADVLARLRKMQAGRTAKEFAESLGISQAYLSDVYAGKREPGPTVLSRMGLSALTVYVERGY